MADLFFEQSKEIANNFIQNIVFIDDKAYKDDTTNNAFSASDVSKIFAETGKICAIYAPKSTLDIMNYNTILKKADVTILDWYLNIKKEENKAADLEADADTDDPRGEFTIELLRELISDAGTDKLKLIIIYTGDTRLPDIKDEIIKELDPELFKVEGYTIKSSNICILIRAKGQGDNVKFEHTPELKPLIVEYEMLPELILTEFTSLTNGLLSNFALSAITSIRNNTSKILGKFSPKLDPAYLGHKIVQQNPNDAKDLLIHLFGDAVTELIDSANIDTNDWAVNWINNRIEEKEIDIEGIKLRVNKDVLCQIIEEDGTDLNQRIQKATKVSISKAKALKNATTIFQYSGININESNTDFAKLTHHKNIFLPKLEAPILTLGTIIKCIQSGSYYVCIQQRCDSVRIKGERRFLFLPLDKDGEHYPIVIDTECKFFINDNSYALRTIKFKPKGDDIAIFAERNKEGKYIFSSIHPDQYEWDR